MGFIKAAADGTFADVSADLTGSLVLRVRTTTPDYTGFRVALAAGTVSPSYACSGGGSIPFSRGCFKADFSVPAGDDFVDVAVPFTAFSDMWSPASGDHTKNCTDDSSVCPTADTLSGVKRIEVWAEGISGKVHLEVKKISSDPAAVQALVDTAPDTAALVTFDGSKSTDFTFSELNDPVMGGRSTGTWTVAGTEPDQYGVFDGEVVDVPSLQAPGFIKTAADGTFADVSADLGGSLVLRVRSTTPDYTGFRVALAAGTVSPSYACSGGGSIPFSGGCYKADFSVPAGDDFVDVAVPFTDFSDKWSPASGDHTANCTDDSSVCLTASALSGIKRIEVWAEGHAGKVHLEVKKISSDPAAVQALVDTAPDTAALVTFDGS